MSLVAREIEQRAIAAAAEREYHQARLALLVLRAEIIRERRKAMPNNLQTPSKITRKAVSMFKNKGGSAKPKAPKKKPRARKK